MEVKSPLNVNSSEDQPSMASVVAPPPPASVSSQTESLPVNNLSNVAGAGVNKRYRPAPAKTFQCRGYGDCRMVFSRSEHLARHIRYHSPLSSPRTRPNQLSFSPESILGSVLSIVIVESIFPDSTTFASMPKQFTRTSWM